MKFDNLLKNMGIILIYFEKKLCTLKLEQKGKKSIENPSGGVSRGVRRRKLLFSASQGVSETPQAHLESVPGRSGRAPGSPKSALWTSPAAPQAPGGHVRSIRDGGVSAARGPS